MIASVEKLDGTCEDREMGEPVCGQDFCDGCGDCLACQYHTDAEWCNAGSQSWWVIYLNNPKNPYHIASLEGAPK
jgi:hypothetical protein